MVRLLSHIVEDAIASVRETMANNIKATKEAIELITDHYIEKVMDIFIKNKHFQDYIRFKSIPDLTGLPEDGTYYYKGNHYQICDQLHNIRQCYDDYDSSSITNDMIVLDIGANIGGFTILAARKAKHVFAVEPLYHDILEDNLRMNNISNVTVLKYGIGYTGLRRRLEYGSKHKEVETISLFDLLKLTGTIDFLKSDCEGGEWWFKEEDIKGIKYFEGEIHDFGGHDCSRFQLFEKTLINAGFIYKKEVHPETMMIHAVRTSTPSECKKLSIDMYGSVR